MLKSTIIPFMAYPLLFIVFSYKIFLSPFDRFLSVLPALLLFKLIFEYSKYNYNFPLFNNIDYNYIYI